MPPYLYFYLALLLLASLTAFISYGLDKSKAKRSQWRIPEAFLLGVGFCGGAMGALLGMRAFRHKTKHWYFWVVNIIGLLWQVAMIVYLLVRSSSAI
jgi:uncharacterized membrane protein YsdA (DUF1294 family)